MRHRLVPLFSLVFFSISLLAGWGDRNPGGYSAGNSEGRSPSKSGGGTPFRRGNGRRKPARSLTSKVPSASRLFVCSKFDCNFGKSFGFSTAGKLVVTNRNDQPDLTNVNVTFTFYPEDGTRHELKRFWVSWKRNEEKTIEVNVRKIQKIEMVGTAKLQSSLHGPGKISVSWTVTP